MKLCPACRAEYADRVRYCPRDGAGLVPVSTASTGTLALYDALVGETLEGRYRVQGRLGEGGLAVVYSGIHLLIEKPVALKVLKSEFVNDPSIVQRFLREAKAASRLSHRNIVSITDFGSTPQGSPFFVMERLMGPTLGDVISGGVALPLGRAIGITEGIGAGLSAAHLQGIVHRDLKPDNVLIVTGEGGEETVKVVDFGLAQVSDAAHRLTRSGQVLGTPEFMAPEQVAGQPVDPRADVFVLGILLYRMLSGRLPFSGGSAVETLSKLLDAAPEPLPLLSIDGHSLEWVGAVISRALAREPSDRPATAQEFLLALQDARTRLSDSPAPLSSSREDARLPADSMTQETRLAAELLGRERSRQSRWRRQLWVILVATLAAIGGVLLGSHLLRGAPSRPLEAMTSKRLAAPLPRVLEQGIERVSGPAHHRFPSREKKVRPY